MPASARFLGSVEPPELAAANPPRLLNDPWISAATSIISPTFTIWPTQLADFDPATGTGEITYQRAEYFTRQAFDNMLAIIKPVGPNEFPENEYAANPTLPFSIEFVSPRTVRIRIRPADRRCTATAGIDARRAGAPGSFLEIRKSRRRLPLRQPVWFGHHSGKSLAHRIPRRAGPAAHRNRPRLGQHHHLHARSCHFPLCGGRRIIRAA